MTHSLPFFAVATRDADLLDIESESQFEMAADADAESPWPAWPDLTPYLGDDEKGYRCAAPMTMPMRFLKEESQPNFINEFTRTVHNFNIAGYPRVKNCDKSRATLDMNLYAAGFVLGAVGGRTPDTCVAGKVAMSFGPTGLKLKDAMVAPNAAIDPMDFIAKLNDLGKTVSARHILCFCAFHDYSTVPASSFLPRAPFLTYPYPCFISTPKFFDSFFFASNECLLLRIAAGSHAQ